MSTNFKMDRELVEPITSLNDQPTTFEACLNARGTYTTEHFVLRLSPRVHELIEAVPTGVYSASSLSAETIQAYSTYLHETVHWWQHVGSTAGLVFSLAYPAHSHVNHTHLRDWLEMVGPRKSIRTWAEKEMLGGLTHENSAVREANIIVNNAMDVEFYKAFTYDPQCAEEIFANRYFECVGHSYWMAYGHLASMLSATFDRNFDHFPDARIWDNEFPKLKAEEHLGFYHGSPIARAPIGLRALFEGQARFCQLQYLAFCSDTPLTVESLKEGGYFADIYVEAFELFLKITNSEWPEEIDDPLIGLFLLICDIALNPTRGFPFQIESYHDFIIDVDPGTRFVRLCHVVGTTKPELRKAITDYSKEEYIQIAAALTESDGYDHPMAALQEIAGWIESVPGVKVVMEEQKSFNYELENLPVRVLFSHFLAFSSDKLENPEFFCWPGAWMTGTRISETTQQLFLSHLSLFSDKADDDGIFPRAFPDKDPEGIKRTFNVFFANAIIYDLTQQWILNDGPFDYDFSWLSQKHSDEEMTQYAKDCFRNMFGVSPDDFKYMEAPKDTT